MHGHGHIQSELLRRGGGARLPGVDHFERFAGDRIGTKIGDADQGGGAQLALCTRPRMAGGSRRFIRYQLRYKKICVVPSAPVAAQIVNRTGSIEQRRERFYSRGTIRLRPSLVKTFRERNPGIKIA